MHFRRRRRASGAGGVQVERGSVDQVARRGDGSGDDLRPRDRSIRRAGDEPFDVRRFVVRGLVVREGIRAEQRTLCHGGLAATKACSSTFGAADAKSRPARFNMAWRVALVEARMIMSFVAALGL